MSFVQIIEFKTSKIDQMRAVGQEWEKATEGKRTTRQRVMCEDRDNPGRYFVIASFDSYDEAMKNSNLPETTEFSQKMMSFADGPPAFYNLDVIEERS